MKYLVVIFFAVLFATASLSASAQKEVVIDGNRYLLHTVSKSETVFSLSQKYKVTPSDLQQANQGLAGVLPVGATVKIPAGKVETQIAPEKPKTAASSGESDYYYHKVAKNQTIASIARQYQVTPDILLKNNPELTNGLVVGQVLKIPGGSASAQNSIPEELVKQDKPIASVSASLPSAGVLPVAGCAPSASNEKQLYKIGFLLPFHLSDQTDSLGKAQGHILDPLKFSAQVVSVVSDSSVVVNGVNIDPRVTGFLEFYEGALIAVDSLRRKGMNIEILTFDASNQHKINQLLSLDEFLELSLIVGPVYPELQQAVASVAAKNRIPMVSPLSSHGEIEKNNPWYFKVNPSRDYQVEQTVQFITREYTRKNFILLQTGGNSGSMEAMVGRLCKEKLAASGGRFFHEYSFQQNGLNGVKALLDENAENIFFIPTDNEAQVSVAVTNLTALAEHHNIVLMGTATLPKLKSIQTENYHKIKLRYLSTYFVDYERPLVKRFVSQYRDIFSGEPTQYSFQGFDVAFYFISSLGRYGKDFRDCLENYNPELTQMRFSFGKVSQFGGQMNHNLFVTSYEPDFSVKMIEELP